jgi:hypothetical protein
MWFVNWPQERRQNEVWLLYDKFTVKAQHLQKQLVLGLLPDFSSKERGGPYSYIHWDNVLHAESLMKGHTSAKKRACETPSLATSKSGFHH